MDPLFPRRKKGYTPLLNLGQSETPEMGSVFHPSLGHFRGTFRWSWKVVRRARGRRQKGWGGAAKDGGPRVPWLVSQMDRREKKNLEGMSAILEGRMRAQPGG